MFKWKYFMINIWKYNIILISIKAGGEGLNLTEASKVVLFEPNYNPFVDNQAFDRVHRIGQTKEVEVVRLYTKGTVETWMQALCDNKKAISRGIFEGTSKINGPTKNDVRELFQEYIRAKWIIKFEINTIN